jgi:hypothetical protein
MEDLNQVSLFYSAVVQAWGVKPSKYSASSLISVVISLPQLEVIRSQHEMVGSNWLDIDLLLQYRSGGCEK